MDYDVLVVTELWRTQKNFISRSYEFITSATNKDKDGNLINDNDPRLGWASYSHPEHRRKSLERIMMAVKEYVGYG